MPDLTLSAPAGAALPAGPKKVLCLHDLSGMGRSGLAAIGPVLATMGAQPVLLPTVLLSTHTGGLGQPARLDTVQYAAATLAHYKQLGVAFDCIYSGYLGSEAQAALVEQAFALWPAAFKVVDPVMGDHGRPYSTVTGALTARIRALCRQAGLILPNCTEAHLLLGRPWPQQPAFDAAGAQALADDVAAFAPGAQVVVTGVPCGQSLVSACAGAQRFTEANTQLPRAFPGTGDLYGAVLVGALLQGGTLRAAVRLAAGFVEQAIRQMPAQADTRFGLWFEPLLPALAAKGVQHGA